MLISAGQDMVLTSRHSDRCLVSCGRDITTMISCGATTAAAEAAAREARRVI